MKQILLLLFITLLDSFVDKVSGQTNRIQNFSFENAGATPALAANWNPGWGGYERVSLSSGGWDQAYAIRLSGPENIQLGAIQRITFNQATHSPILITARIRGDEIANISTDQIGASIDCRIKFVGLSESEISYCPSTPITKNYGTFHWRYIGFNTAHLINGEKPIEWVEVRLRRGAVSGTAWFDDVHVSEYPAGLFTGAVTLMFDDGYPEHRTIALASMRDLGMSGVVAPVVKYTEQNFPGYMSLAQIQEIANAGWEVVAHSYDHSNLTVLSPSSTENQLYVPRQYWSQNGFNVRSFALPFGSYNAFVLGLNEERGYFGSMRNSENGYNPMGAFPYSIKVQKVETSTTLAQVNSWLLEARNRKVWLILLFHKIRTPCPDQYCISEQNFQNFLTAVSSSALPVVTYEEGLTLVKSPR